MPRPRYGIGAALTASRSRSWFPKDALQRLQIHLGLRGTNFTTHTTIPLVACAPSPPSQPSYYRRITTTRTSMLKLERQVKDEARESPVRFLEHLPLEG